MQERSIRHAFALVLVVAAFTASCAPAQHRHAPLFADAPGQHEVLVSAKIPWTPTGLVVTAGDAIEIAASGTVRVEKWSYFGNDGTIDVGPEGTYDYGRDDTYRKYPLAAAGHGPVAPFGLIGKIGESGRAFHVGAGAIRTAGESGTLHLGVNDFDHTDNDGAFHAAVRVRERGAARPPAVDARPVLRTLARPRPVDDARVLMIFVDGLRYDALREMAYAGYLPNFRELFFEGGVDVGPTYTVSPSNTIVATTASLTGSWPDRTGLFSQLVFDREEGEINYLATPEGPAKSAEHIDEAWWTAPLRDPDRPPLLKRRVADAGHEFRSTVIPVMPDYPPDRYVQRVANEMPLMGAHLLKDYYFDRAETAYAVDDVIEHDARVMFVYYTGFDSATHRSTRGPWGESRRDLYRIDRDLGVLRRELEREDLARKAYWVLYADHGSTGGKHYIPQSWDVANDFFYRAIVDRDDDRDPDRTGGLGLNVMYQLNDVTLRREHPDVDDDDFMTCVAQAFDLAWVALPKGGARSRDWSDVNHPDDLARYRVHPDYAEVDVVQRLLDATSERGNLYPDLVSDHPVAFVLVPMRSDALLVAGRESRAVIERRPHPSGEARRFEYRYRTVAAPAAGSRDRARSAGVEKSARPTVDGDVVEPHLRAADPAAEPVGAPAADRDPLGYLADPALAELLERDGGWLGAWHDDREWLAATADAFYPDAVVAYAHMLLDDPVTPRIEKRARYDMAIVAAPGWNFSPGQYDPAPDHGGADRWAKRIPFLIAGPNLPRGVRVDRPARIVDVVPTALEMAAIDYDPASLDGIAVREIWSPHDTAVARDPEPVPFHVDEGLAVPLTDDEVVHGPLGHDSRRWYDLHNVTANLATLTSQEVLRMADRGADVVLPGAPVRPTHSGIVALAHTYDRLPEGKLKRRPAELIDALRLHTITIGELSSPTQSLQNIDRIALTIDWLRNVLNDPFGEPWPARFTPMTPVDLTLKQVSTGLLAGRRVLLEWMTRMGNAAVRGVEGAYRETAEAAGGAPWETPSTLSEATLADWPAPPEEELGLAADDPTAYLADTRVLAPGLASRAYAAAPHGGVVRYRPEPVRAHARRPPATSAAPEVALSALAVN